MIERDSKDRQGGWFWRHTRKIRARPAFSLSTGIFLGLTGALVAAQMPTQRALLLAFDIAAIIFLGAMAYAFAHAEVSSIRLRARKLDEGRWGFLWSSVAVSAVVLVALAMELHAGKEDGLVEILLAGSSLLLSWLFMNTIFALHYAHEFYGEAGEKNAGLDFPGTKEPDYWDFLYFAIVIGMTFQVSDVQISERRIRRTALAHGVVAFFFNVIIIALTVNVVAGRA